MYDTPPIGMFTVILGSAQHPTGTLPTLLGPSPSTTAGRGYIPDPVTRLRIFTVASPKGLVATECHPGPSETRPSRQLSCGPTHALMCCRLPESNERPSKGPACKAPGGVGRGRFQVSPPRLCSKPPPKRLNCPEGNASL